MPANDNEGGRSIHFDKAKRNRLRAAYEAAKGLGKDQFTFEGHEYLVSYARYLLEYLDTKLG